MNPIEYLKTEVEQQKKIMESLRDEPDYSNTSYYAGQVDALQVVLDTIVVAKTLITGRFHDC